MLFINTGGTTMRFILPDELVLLRHGESVGNVANRLSRAGDHSHYTAKFRATHSSTWALSDRGQSQAKKARQWFQDNQLTMFDFAAHSDMRRAIDTAQLANPAELSFHETYLVRERSLGLFETIDFGEKTHGLWGESWRSRDEQPLTWLPPGGESTLHTVERVKLFLDYMAYLQPHCKRALVVTHGHTMWAFRYLLEGWDEHEFKRYYVSDAPEHTIYNCHVLHYREQVWSGRYTELRSVCTYNPNRYDSGWKRL